MWEGVQKQDNFADVVCVWPLVRKWHPHLILNKAVQGLWKIIFPEFHLSFICSSFLGSPPFVIRAPISDGGAERKRGKGEISSYLCDLWKKGEGEMCRCAKMHLVPLQMIVWRIAKCCWSVLPFFLNNTVCVSCKGLPYRTSTRIGDFFTPFPSKSAK